MSERNKTIMRKYRAGVSQAAIAEEFGLTRQRVHQIVTPPKKHVPKPCWVCKRPLTPRNSLQRYHVGECAQVARLFKEKTNYARDHRKAVARWTVKSSNDPHKIAWAERVLSGRYNRSRTNRYVRPDSKAYELLAKYDLLRYLPPEVRVLTPERKSA